MSLNSHIQFTVIKSAPQKTILLLDLIKFDILVQ